MRISRLVRAPSGETFRSQRGQRVPDTQRRVELTAPKGAQQRTELAAEPARGQGDLVLDSVRLVLGDPNPDGALLQHRDDCLVVRRNQRREMADAFLPRPVSQPAQQLGTKSALLPRVNDGDRHLGALGVVSAPDVASDAQAPAISGVERAKSLMVVMVDLGEVAQLSRRQARLAGKETQLARLQAQAGETLCQQRRIPWLDRANDHDGAVTQCDGATLHRTSQPETTDCRDSGAGRCQIGMAPTSMNTPSRHVHTEPARES